MSLIQKIKENLIKKHDKVDNTQQTLMIYDVAIEELMNFKQELEVLQSNNMDNLKEIKRKEVEDKILSLIDENEDIIHDAIKAI